MTCWVGRPKSRPGPKAFVAYTGRYSFYGNHVVHYVELSLFPNWVGSDQERWAELAGDRLSLSASSQLLAGKQQVPRLGLGAGRPVARRRLTARRRRLVSHQRFCLALASALIPALTSSRAGAIGCGRAAVDGGCGHAARGSVSNAAPGT